MPAIDYHLPNPSDNAAAGLDSSNPFYNPLTSHKGSADQIMSQVLRSQWADYLKTYQPESNLVMNQTSYNNPALIAEQVGQGVSDVNQAYNSGAVTQQQQYSRYGIAPSADQQAYIDRSNNIGRSAAVVDAANTIRTRISDRNRQIAVGGIPNITSQAIRTSTGTNGG
jgi:hypothetical protein